MVAVLCAVGADLSLAREPLCSLKPSPGRGQVYHVTLPQGQVTVIDDSYNAGPDSMKAALAVLGSMKPQGEGRRLAILGDMLELGQWGRDLHLDLAQDLERHEVAQLFAVGPLMGALYESLPPQQKGGWTDQPQDLVNSVLSSLQDGDVILIKGSRGQRAYEGRMRLFVEAILNQRLNQEAC
jgi:UDP-N-acetylmuramoyl-tripeptide--D-alanyl-D-alanine ligase